MPNQHTVPGTLMAVVGHEERPYDRDLDGTPITKRWDILSCGHALPSRLIKSAGKRVIRQNAEADFYENYDQRKCKVCP
jgi:hypothetical protein